MLNSSQLVCFPPLPLNRDLGGRFTLPPPIWDHMWEPLISPLGQKFSQEARCICKLTGLDCAAALKGNTGYSTIHPVLPSASLWLSVVVRL
jgi:hypothetical protein